MIMPTKIDYKTRLDKHVAKNKFKANYPNLAMMLEVTKTPLLDPKRSSGNELKIEDLRKLLFTKRKYYIKDDDGYKEEMYLTPIDFDLLNYSKYVNSKSHNISYEDSYRKHAFMIFLDEIKKDIGSSDKITYGDIARDKAVHIYEMVALAAFIIVPTVLTAGIGTIIPVAVIVGGAVVHSLMAMFENVGMPRNIPNNSYTIDSYLTPDGEVFPTIKRTKNPIHISAPSTQISNANIVPKNKVETNNSDNSEFKNDGKKDNSNSGSGP
jgi:hypothetical protein